MYGRVLMAVVYWLVWSEGIKTQCTTTYGCKKTDQSCKVKEYLIELLLQKITRIDADVTSLLVKRTHLQYDTRGGEDAIPRDCADLYKSGERTSGVYTVYTYAAGSPVPFQVWCDMDTAGGGWMVFQRRKDGSVDFYRKWKEYEDGFGSISGEHWLGNLALHALTDYKPQLLRVDLEDHEGVAAYAQYGKFFVASKTDKFAINVNTYSGNAGNGLASHNGQKFSTKDQDNDRNRETNCAVKFHGAWWYAACQVSNLNGLYRQTGEHNGTSDTNIVGWYQFRGYYYSIKFTEMKIRPLDF